jgi:hypothetical protein
MTSRFVLFVWLAMCVCWSADDRYREAPAGEPPQDLLEGAFRWEAQSGTWKVDKQSATGTGGERVAKLAARQSVRLSGRWLTCKVGVTGPAAKAGVWFSGIQTKQGEVLGFAIEPASGSLTNGAGKVLAELPPADAAGRDLLFTFTPEKVTVHSAGKQLTEVEVNYPEATATPSFFVERGAAVFRELLLGSSAAAAPITGPSVKTPPVGRTMPAVPSPAPAANAPAVIPVPAAGTVREAVRVETVGEKMTTLKSGWNDYFGVHFATAPGPWKTVRQYDGPEFAQTAKGRHTGEVKSLPGPFAGVPVDLSLADFRDWKRADARGLNVNLGALIQDDRAGLFIAPWTSPFTKDTQDEVWMLMKQIYGAQVGAEGRVFFQWGDDLNARRLGAVPSPRARGFTPRGGAQLGRGANGPADVAAYAENYFAPAVEAVRKASDEIYHDPAKIPVLLGSCALASEPANRTWYKSVLDYELTGTNAPSLKGKKVVQLVDFLTVNYPFGKTNDAGALQELWDRYGAQVKGLWVTEEFGPRGRGATNLLRTASLYLGWVGKNQLDARQTRLLWNLPDEARAPGLPTLVQSLGQSLAGPLRMGLTAVAGGQVHCIAAGEKRFVLVCAPAVPRKGKRPPTIADVTLAVSEAQAGFTWKARYVPAQGLRDAVLFVPLAVEKEAATLKVAVPTTMLDAWVVLLEAE